MVHVVFDPDTLSIDELLTQVEQTGGGFQYFEGMPYQRGRGGTRSQRGAGFGDVFRSIFRFILPLAKSAGHHLKPLAAEIGREGLSTTARVLNDIAQGERPLDALQRESQEGVKTLLNKAAARVQKGGGGVKRRRKKLPSLAATISLQPEDAASRLVGKRCLITTTKRRKRADVFGPY